MKKIIMLVLLVSGALYGVGNDSSKQKKIYFSTREHHEDNGAKIKVKIYSDTQRYFHKHTNTKTGTVFFSGLKISKDVLSLSFIQDPELWFYTYKYLYKEQKNKKLIKNN